MIKQVRIEKKFTQKKLGRELNISQSYVSKIENRRTKSISINMILKISTLLDIDPVELFIFLIEY